MYTLKTEASFDSAHFLAGYEGKCSNLHGHRWRVVVYVSAEEIQQSGHDRGMLMDFSELKQAVRGEADALDHALIIEKGSLKPATMQALEDEGFRILSFDFRPTAENLAQYFFHQITKRGISISQCDVYETPDNCAIYTPEQPV